MIMMRMIIANQIIMIVLEFVMEMRLFKVIGKMRMVMVLEEEFIKSIVHQMFH